MTDDGARRGPSSGVPEIPGYDQLEQIGRGGFSTVYRAHEIAFNRAVALKVLDASDLTSDTQARFERECQAIGALSGHPHIVTVFAAGLTADGRPYIAMDLMEEGSLADRLKHTGPVSPAEAARIGLDLLEAIGAAHASGVLHRDIKPANVLISRFGTAQLGDFGISTVPGGYQTTTGNISATLGYAAPEVIDGERATPESDLYSLAATLASLLTGDLPFARQSGEAMGAWLKRLLVDPPPNLTRVGASPQFAAVIQQAMQKTPGNRFGSAAAFRNALSTVPELSGATPPVASVDTTVARVPSQPADASTLITPRIPEPAPSYGWSGANPSAPMRAPARGPSSRTGMAVIAGVVVVALIAVVAVVLATSHKSTPTRNASASTPITSAPPPSSTPIASVPAGAASTTHHSAADPTRITASWIVVLASIPEGGDNSYAMAKRTLAKLTARGGFGSPSDALHLGSSDGASGLRSGYWVVYYVEPSRAAANADVVSIRERSGVLDAYVRCANCATSTGATTAVYFHAPQGNVNCEIGAQVTVCSVVQADETFVLPHTGAAYREPGLRIPDTRGRLADWGSSVSNGSVTCSIPESYEPKGIVCRDSVSGHGFEASKVASRQHTY
ncbi:MAG TPA: protein kinase [Mycobacteriales bacterium]|nr:protein kinase [Mycobacteriales bacterium]